MVGGIVTGVIRRIEPAVLEEKGTLLTVKDSRRGGADFCCIRVHERRKDDGAPVEIRLGDAVRWQGEDVMWTPQGVRHLKDPGGCGTRWDIPLPRVGHAFAPGHAS